MDYYGMHVKIPKKGIKDSPLTAMAFFVGPPQNWCCSVWDDSIVKTFKTSLEESKTLSSDKIVAHGCYLLNPSSANADVRNKTKKRFYEEILLCDKLNIGNYVFHPGTNKDTQKGLQMAVDLINFGLSETKNVSILVENMTKTNTLCQTWQEVEWVISHCDKIKNEKGLFRVGNCLDTAHCWGAGNKKGMFMDTLLNDYDRIVGIQHLQAIHLNDSKVEYGSNKDRHEDLLKGKIPLSFWNSFIFDKRVKTIPTILETPSNCFPILHKIIQDNGVSEIKEEKNHEVTEGPYKNLDTYLPENWKKVIGGEMKKPYFTNLINKLNNDSIKGNIYPPIDKIFNVFTICKPDKIKVVICGQDPYHSKGQAEGFSFSVPENIKIPSSLKNIYKELSNDIQGFVIPNHGHLEKWVRKGVFLLNSSLTVIEGTPGCHMKQGWQEFTDNVLHYINNHCENIVFMLWGNFAKNKSSLIDKNKHCILSAPHPSGLSANKGFYGCKHFSKCNDFLESKGIEKIDWSL